MEELKNQIFDETKSLIIKGEYARAFSALEENILPQDDFVSHARCAELFKQIPPGALGLRAVRIAIAASSTINHFVDVLVFHLAQAGVEAEIYETQFDAVYQAIIDKTSDLYSFRPDITIIFTNYRDVRIDIEAGTSEENVKNLVKKEVEKFASLWTVLHRNCGCHIIQNNADLPDFRVFGNYEGTALWGNVNVLRQFNLELAKAVRSGVTIFDIDYISSIYGKSKWHDQRYWHYSRHAFVLDAIGMVAHEMAMLVAAVKGLTKKCIVVDLDNTLWGGIVADDGVEGIELGSGVNGEAFVEFQRYLLKLKKRGIVLAACSKNDENTAKMPFSKHPDMQIKLEDFAVFQANWKNKADNIREIAAKLNLGLDSIVFVDDNPAECELVRQLLPMVSVPDLGQDPTEYIKALNRESYFETISYSQEDGARSEYYRNDAERLELKEKFTDLSCYLRSLEMSARVGKFDEFNLPRIVQLINKSNQFHLTTTRYTEGQVRAMLENASKYCRYFTLSDKFGDNGLISVVILDKQEDRLFIDTWVMSCRVLSREMEEFICQEIILLAQQTNSKRIVGKYIPTNKNQLVCRLYERLHFNLIEENKGTTSWELDLQKDVPEYQTFIKKELAQPVG